MEEEKRIDLRGELEEAIRDGIRLCRAYAACIENEIKGITAENEQQIRDNLLNETRLLNVLLTTCTRYVCAADRVMYANGEYNPIQRGPWENALHAFPGNPMKKQPVKSNTRKREGAMKIIWEPTDEPVSKDEVKDYLRQAVLKSIITYAKYVEKIFEEIETMNEESEGERRETLLQEIRLMSVMVTTFTRYVREMDERTAPFPG